MNVVLRRCVLGNTNLSRLASAFHTSCSLNEKKKFPFPEFVRPPKDANSPIFRSGDKKGLGEIDLTKPILQFQDSKELETADESVKKIFSLDFAPKSEMVKFLRFQFQKKVQRHNYDSVSFETRIAKLTVRIRRWQFILKQNYTRKLNKKILSEAIVKRNKMLRVLRSRDSERFEWLLEELNISYLPPLRFSFPLTQKYGVRLLAQKYCEQVRIAKLQAYKEQLKAQQAEYLKEREEMLKFIAKEEKELGLTDATTLELVSETMAKKPYPVESSMQNIARRVNNTEETALKPMPEKHPLIDYY